MPHKVSALIGLTVWEEFGETQTANDIIVSFLNCHQLKYVGRICVLELCMPKSISPKQIFIADN